MLTRILLPALRAHRVNADLRRENELLRDTIRVLEVSLAYQTQRAHRLTITLNEIAANEAAGADRCESATILPFVGCRK
jgi:hypothetical protein